MAEIDASIPLQIKPVQIKDPMEMATAAAHLKDLAITGREKQLNLAQQQRAFDDNSYMRQAAQESTTKDPNTGMPVLDRQAYISKISSRDPMLAQKVGMSLNAQDLEKLKQNVEIKNSVMHSFYDQKSYDDALDKLHQINPNDADAVRGALGPTFNGTPDFGKKLEGIQKSTYVGTEQARINHEQAVLEETKVGHALEKQRDENAERARQAELTGVVPGQGGQPGTPTLKAQEFAQAKAVKQAELTGQMPGGQPTMAAKEAELKRQEFERNIKKDYAQQNQETLQALQSARGNQSVQKAENDIYSDAKVNSLVAQGKDKKGNFDPNALNMTHVRLLSSEVGKMATGGVPTQDELHLLTPGAVPQYLSEMAAKVENKPTHANAGAFVKALQAYSNSIAVDAKNLLKENYQGVIESKKAYLRPEDYGTLNDQFLGRLNGTTRPSEWSAKNAPQEGKKPSGIMSIHEWKASQTKSAER